MVQFHRWAVVAISLSSIFPNEVAAKKKVKKATEEEPAYRIENYQENVPPPEDLAKQMAEEKAAQEAIKMEKLDELLKDLDIDPDADNVVREKQRAFAEKEAWKEDKLQENLNAMNLDDMDFDPSAFGNLSVDDEDESEDAPIEDYRDPVSEDYKSSYVPIEGESFEFEAEVNRMLDIVINSLYQNKDVFLRELISNASDALDKIRFTGLTDPSKLADKEELEVKVQYDRDAQTLTIIDSGIGMTKSDLVTNLGTVARSGTSNFLNAVKETDATNAMNMIGQFGVGFYSVFLVGDHVTVASKHPDEPVQHVWSASNGGNNFTVAPDPRGNTLGRGTEITIHLKGDCLHYIDPFKLENLVTHYSEFITYPISVRTTASLKVKADKSEDEEDLDDDVDEEEEEEEEEELEDVISHSWKRVNSNAAIWTREKDSITEDEYRGFFNVVAKDSTNSKTCATWSHFSAEGNINFKSILYLPDDLPPMEMHMSDEQRESFGLKLYVRKVLISDKFKSLLPDYLSFIKGVVDSDDLPLNVNRETLQESKIIKVISKKLTRKTIEMIRVFSKQDWEPEEPEIDEETGEPLENFEEQEHPYLTWYKKFSQALKRGVLEDPANQKRLLKLLRYKTTASNGEWRSLEEVLGNMKDWQDEFYFIAGPDDEEIKRSKFLQKFNKKGVEVLILTDPIDEYLFNNLSDFEGHRFHSVTKEGVKFKDEDQDTVKRRNKAYKEKFSPLTKYLKKTYGESVSRVSISQRLEDYPAIVSNADYAHSANMERILRAQAHQNGQDPEQFKSIRVLEINPRHPFVTKLLSLVEEASSDDVDESTKDAAWMLHDMALLNSGYTITDSQAYSNRMMRVIKNSLEIDSMELEDEIEVPIEEDEPPMEDEGSSFVNTDEIVDEDIHMEL